MILHPARITDADSRPRSVEYGDIYYASDGANESRRVFIEPLGLPALFANPPDTSVRIGELGFGTGRNFLAVSQAFLDHAPEFASLDYVALEKHPLAVADIEQIFERHAPRPSLSSALIEAWPHGISGWHRRYFAGGRIRLLLYQGDALDGLSDFQGVCHAWLLDGFDPRCNPQMWSETLLARVAEASEMNTRVASYTSQGAVRRRLEALGFAMRKVDQQPHKRHSLVGTRISGGRTPVSNSTEVAVVGAGFAGVFTAHLLALRGIRAHLFEAGSAPMPIALAHARLGDANHPLMQLRALARGYSNDWYRRLGASSGVLEVPSEPRDVERMQRSGDYWALADPSLRLLDEAEARQKSGLSGIRKSLWHGQCHIVTPHARSQLLQHPRIVRHRTRVVACQPEGAHWKLTLDQGASQSFERAVVSAGPGCLDLIPELDVHAIQGQMEQVAMLPAPTCAMVGQGFAAPTQNGEVCIGATFERTPLSDSEAMQENCARTRQWFNALGHPVSITHRASWRGARVYRRNRMPIAGEFAAGLWVNCAFGASGSLLAPLCADIIASQIAGDPLPITRTLMTESISPM